jgi:hypothetical protein
VLCALQDAYARGEILIENADQGFAVIDGVLTTVGRRSSNELLGTGNSSAAASESQASFTLVTPTRHYRFAAENAQEKDEWVKALATVIESPAVRYS